MHLVVDGIIFQLAPQGGVARLFSEIIPRMCNIDQHMSIQLLTSDSGSPSLPSAQCVQSISLRPPYERILRPRRFFWPLIGHTAERVKRNVTRQSRHNIWHSTYYTPAPDWTGPVVVTVYDLLYEKFPQLFNRADDHHFRVWKKRCVEAADAVICISQATANDVQDQFHVDGEKIAIIPLAASDIFRILDADTLASPVAEPYLLYVGGRRAYKNFETLLEAYSRWKAKADIRMVVVGDRWRSQERRRLSNLQIEHRVHLETDVDDQKLCRLYNNAIAFVYPSLFEGFGIPLLEAAACGCPIIASRIPSTLEVMDDVPIYFESDEVDSLVNALDLVLLEKNVTVRRTAGLARSKQYTWEETAQQTLRLYGTLRRFMG